MIAIRHGELADHFRYLVTIICPNGEAERIAALRELMEQDELEADVSCFWYGAKGAREPAIPAFATGAFYRLGAPIETDFDTD